MFFYVAKWICSREADSLQNMSGLETWPEYVRRVTKGMAQGRAAKLSGVAQTNIGRWLRGETPAPRAESVVAFARSFGENPLEALIAAGYLTAEEASAETITTGGLGWYTTRQLLDELERRIITGDGISK